MPDREEVKNQLIRALHWQSFWIAMCFVAIAGVVVLGFLDSNSKDERIAKQSERVEQIAENNLQALCQFRFDLQRRWEAGVEFLQENPDGIPGISPETLQRSIDSQRATLDALAVLECAGVPNPVVP